MWGFPGVPLEHVSDFLSNIPLGKGSVSSSAGQRSTPQGDPGLPLTQGDTVLPLSPWG